VFLFEHPLEGVSLFNLCVDLFLFELLEAIFNVFDGTLGLLEEFTSSLPIDVEAKNLGFIEVYLRWQDNGVRVVLEEDLREGSSKVGTIYVDLPELGQVHFFASWAEDFEARGFQGIGETNW
jgi:hypothetical protein